jgi:hypothetical protein
MRLQVDFGPHKSNFAKVCWISPKAIIFTFRSNNLGHELNKDVCNLTAFVFNEEAL